MPELSEVPKHCTLVYMLSNTSAWNVSPRCCHFQGSFPRRACVYCYQCHLCFLEVYVAVNVVYGGFISVALKKVLSWVWN